MSLRSARGGVLLLAACLVAGCGDDPTPDATKSFDEAVAAVGDAFGVARDRFLEASPAAQAEVIQRVRDAEETAWMDEATAYVLEGWSRHARDYRELLAAPRWVDPRGIRHFDWEVERPAALQAAGPLLVELLLKRTAEPGGRETAQRTIPYVALTKDALDQDLLLRGTARTSGLNRQQRRDAAWVLANIERPKVEPREALRMLGAEVLASATDRATARYLVEIVSRSGRRRQGTGRDEIAEQLDAIEVSAQDKSFLMQRIGLLGGEKATDIVVDYVDGVDDPKETAWALDLLGPHLVYTTRLGSFLKSRIAPVGPPFEGRTSERMKVIESYGRLARRYLAEGQQAKVAAILDDLLAVPASAVSDDPRLKRALDDLVTELKRD